MIGKTIYEIELGDSDTFSKTVTESDVYLFAGVTGDFNPAHIDEEYSKNTFFKTRIAHGMLIAGFISTVIGSKLPGNGSIYINQDLNFLFPVRIGDTVTARVEVIEISIENNRIKLKTTCENQEGIIVLEGEAIISPPISSKKL